MLKIDTEARKAYLASKTRTRVESREIGDDEPVRCFNSQNELVEWVIFQ